LEIGWRIDTDETSRIVLIHFECWFANEKNVSEREQLVEIGTGLNTVERVVVD